MRTVRTVTDPRDPYGYDAIVEWLRARPRNEALRWCDVEAPVEPGDLHTHWVDVAVAQAHGELDYRWLWSVVDPNHVEDAPDEIVVPFDVTLWREWDEAQRWYRDEPSVQTRVGEVLSPELRSVFAGEPRPVGAWRRETIRSALRQWCAVHADRPDLDFVWDPDAVPSPSDEIRDLVRAVEQGIEPVYAIADGIEVSDHVMDFLLSLDPDEAASLTAHLEQAFRPIIDELRARDTPPTIDESSD